MKTLIQTAGEQKEAVTMTPNADEQQPCISDERARRDTGYCRSTDRSVCSQN